MLWPEKIARGFALFIRDRSRTQRPPKLAPSSDRLKDRLRAHDTQGEKLIAVGQAGIASFVLALHLIAQSRNGFQTDNIWVVITLAALVGSSVFRYVLVRGGDIPERRLDLLTVADFGIFLLLIWSYQFAYDHPAGGSLKAPSVILLSVLIALRCLRFHPRSIAVAGIAAIVGWSLMTLMSITLDGAAAVTHDYVTYLTSHKILIGAEIERLVALTALTAALSAAAYRARCILSEASHSQDYLDALKAAESNLENARLERNRALEAMSELRKRDEELTAQNERFNDSLETMSQGLCMFDREKRLIVCNRRYLEMYDLPSSLSERGTHFRKIIEHRIKTGIYSGDDPESYIWERLAAVEERKRSTKIQRLKNSRVIAIVHEPRADGGWLATHEDITELQKVQEELAHMAHHDALTGLPNRLLLQERIKEAVSSAEGGVKFALLCMDLDRFKNVNDTLGHSFGDELLKEVGNRILGCLRKKDTVARLGGDEFAVLQVSDNLPNDATVLASRLCQLLSEPINLGDHQVIVSASVGITIAPDDGLNPDQLIKNADMALYRAKDDGRGVYRFFEPEMDAHMQARCRLERDLRRALEHKEFEVHYQPLIDSETGDVTGFEALLRWPHADGGNVPASEFVPLAEEIGLIMPLGDWVIRKACNDAANWPPHVTVAVNLSPAQFKSQDLVGVVFKALAESGIAAGRLEIEITENALLENTESTLKKLHQLRDMGVRIAMDDFGTGYSSLSYLRSFPFDKIKLDGSFLNDLSETGDATAIVNAVASLSKSLGMVTTAEGVETEEQCARVRAAGYTQMQGFLFSPALPAREINEKYFASPRKARSSA